MNFLRLQNYRIVLARSSVLVQNRPRGSQWSPTITPGRLNSYRTAKHDILRKMALYFHPALCLSDFHSHKRVNNQTKKTNNFDKQCQNLAKLARSISEADMECKFSGFPNPESKDFRIFLAIP